MIPYKKEDGVYFLKSPTGEAIAEVVDTGEVGVKKWEWVLYPDYNWRNGQTTPTMGTAETLYDACRYFKRKLDFYGIEPAKKDSEYDVLSAELEAAKGKLAKVLEVAEWIRDSHGDYISREIEDRIRTALGEEA